MSEKCIQNLLIVLTLLIITVSADFSTFDLPNLCTGLPEGTLVRNTQNCNAYYECFNGKPMLQKCAANELFNHITRKCDMPENVECFSCPIDENYIDIPVPNECNQFIRCYKNQSEQLTCNDGLAFDQKYGMCNLIGKVICPFTVECPKYHENPIYTRDPEDCSM